MIQTIRSSPSPYQMWELWIEMRRAYMRTKQWSFDRSISKYSLVLSSLLHSSLAFSAPAPPSPPENDNSNFPPKLNLQLHFEQKYVNWPMQPVYSKSAGKTATSKKSDAFTKMGARIFPNAITEYYWIQWNIDYKAIWKSSADFQEERGDCGGSQGFLFGIDTPESSHVWLIPFPSPSFNTARVRRFIHFFTNKISMYFSTTFSIYEHNYRKFLKVARGIFWEKTLQKDPKRRWPVKP